MKFISPQYFPKLIWMSETQISCIVRTSGSFIIQNEPPWLIYHVLQETIFYPQLSKSTWVNPNQREYNKPANPKSRWIWSHLTYLTILMRTNYREVVVVFNCRINIRTPFKFSPQLCQNDLFLFSTALQQKVVSKQSNQGKSKSELWY